MRCARWLVMTLSLMAAGFVLPAFANWPSGGYYGGASGGYYGGASGGYYGGASGGYYGGASGGYYGGASGGYYGGASGGYYGGASGGYYGQWGASGGTPYVDMTPVYVSNIYNWSGAQPMGFSYLPPMGLGAINNSLSFGRAFGAR